MNSTSPLSSLVSKPARFAGLFDRRAAGDDDVHAHRLGENVSERRLAEARRAAEQNVVERFLALAGGFDGQFESLLHLALSLKSANRLGRNDTSSVLSCNVSVTNRSAMPPRCETRRQDARRKGRGAA